MQWARLANELDDAYALLKAATTPISCKRACQRPSAASRLHSEASCKAATDQQSERLSGPEFVSVMGPIRGHRG